MQGVYTEIDIDTLEIIGDRFFEFAFPAITDLYVYHYHSHDSTLPDLYCRIEANIDPDSEDEYILNVTLDVPEIDVGYFKDYVFYTNPVAELCQALNRLEIDLIAKIIHHYKNN